jgi:hypothetical protein
VPRSIQILVCHTCSTSCTPATALLVRGTNTSLVPWYQPVLRTTRRLVLVQYSVDRGPNVPIPRPHTPRRTCVAQAPRTHARNNCTELMPWRRRHRGKIQFAVHCASTSQPTTNRKRWLCVCPTQPSTIARLNDSRTLLCEYTRSSNADKKSPTRTGLHGVFTGLMAYI